MAKKNKSILDKLNAAMQEAIQELNGREPEGQNVHGPGPVVVGIGKVASGNDIVFVAQHCTCGSHDHVVAFNSPRALLVISKAMRKIAKIWSEHGCNMEAAKDEIATVIDEMRED